MAFIRGIPLQKRVRRGWHHRRSFRLDSGDGTRPISDYRSIVRTLIMRHIYIVSLYLVPRFAAETEEIAKELASSIEGEVSKIPCIDAKGYASLPIMRGNKECK